MLWQWPFALIHCGRGYVAIKRIQKFLLYEEMNRRLPIEQDDSEEILNRSVYPKEDSETTAIRLENVTSKWRVASKRIAGILNSSLNVPSGELCAVIGPVGSGFSKSFFFT